MLAICKSKQEAKCRLHEHLDQIAGSGTSASPPPRLILDLLQNCCHTALKLTADSFILPARWQMPQGLGTVVFSLCWNPT